MRRYRSLLLALAICSVSCGPDKTEKISSSQPIAQSQDGESLAKKYCTQCHIYVAPDKLPTEYWKSVLSKMAMHMGFEGDRGAYYGNTPVAVNRIDSAHIFPTEPTLAIEEWQKLVLFYLESSTNNINQGIRPTIDFEFNQFKVKVIPWKSGHEGTTMVKILQPNRIAVGGHFGRGTTNEFTTIDIEGNEIAKRKIGSALTSIDRGHDGLYMTFMGEFEADDTPTGTIGRTTGNHNLNLNEPIEILLSNRERPVNIVAVDMNNDKRTDMIVSEFGKFLGGLYLYLQTESGGYTKKIIYDGPGAISTFTRDINDDGLPDVYALISQGDEGIYLFINKGDGEFSTKKILQFPPYYGSVHMELIDFDQDGIEDIIYSNGDSGDFGTPEKAFHGIRFFKGIGNQKFQQRWFYPQQGAYKTQVVDFDEDGDLDIASIGFFAYNTPMPEEGFLYLENLGSGLKKTDFKPFSFVNASNSSFIVMDSGDIDGDGDIDIVLGASTSLMNEEQRTAQLQNWSKMGGAIVILENTLK